MNNELLRTRTLDIMCGFLKEEVYKDNLDEKEIAELCVFYYDLVESVKENVIEEDNNRLSLQVKRDKEAADLKAQGIIDASDAFAVDMAGGPHAVDNSTIYKG